MGDIGAEFEVIEIVLTEEISDCNGKSYNGNVNRYLLDETIFRLIKDNKLGENYKCESFSELYRDVTDFHCTVANCLKEGRDFDFTTSEVSEDLKSLLKKFIFVQNVQEAIVDTFA